MDLFKSVRLLFQGVANAIRELPQYFNEEERRLVTRSLIIGVVVWAVVFLVRTAVLASLDSLLAWIEAGPSLWLVLVPLLLGALGVAALSRYRYTLISYHDRQGQLLELNDIEGDGLERAIPLYYASEPSLEQTLKGQEGVEVRWQMPTFTLALRKSLATVATIGTGGSGGLQASVTLIGESLAAGLFKPRRSVDLTLARLGPLRTLQRWWQANTPDELQTAQLSGIAAAAATLFGTPFAAAFFATEVMYRRRPLIEKLIYALISALVAFFLSDVATANHPALFEVERVYVPPTDLRYFGVLMLMAAVISVVSIYFSRARGLVERGFLRLLPDVWQRHALGAAVTGLVAIGAVWLLDYLALGEQGLALVLGPGVGFIGSTLVGEVTVFVALIALAAKMLATLMTIGSGGSAGLLVPSLYFGSAIAAAFAAVFDYEPMVLVIPAMTASLVSIVNVPLAAILFAVEMFSGSYMLPALLVLVVSALLSFNNSIYRTQRETFDKRQVLPGVSVRREAIPPQWAGQTLIELDFRRHFDLNVIGLVEVSGEDGLPRIQLGAAASVVLEEGDILVVLGRDEKLNALEATLKELRGQARGPGEDQPPAGLG